MSVTKPTAGKTTYGYATNGSNKMPFKFGDGVLVDEKDYKGKAIYISGKDVFLPDVVVQTSYDEFIKLINTTDKRQATHIFPQVWDAIKNVDFDKVYKEQGKAWSNLMDDIVIYYACRFVLFKTPAPIIDMNAIPK
jgi:hypothetical protein